MAKSFKNEIVGQDETICRIKITFKLSNNQMQSVMLVRTVATSIHIIIVLCKHTR